MLQNLPCENKLIGFERSEHTCQREMWSEWVGSKVEKLAPYVDISGYWMRWLSARRGINHKKGSIFVTIFTCIVNHQHHQSSSSHLSLSPSPLNWCDKASQGLKAGAGAQGSAVALLAKTLLACKLAHVARNWKPRGAKFKPFWHFGKNVFCFQPGLPREMFVYLCNVQNVCNRIFWLKYGFSFDIALMTLQLAYMGGCIKHCKEELWYKKEEEVQKRCPRHL